MRKNKDDFWLSKKVANNAQETAQCPCTCWHQKVILIFSHYPLNVLLEKDRICTWTIFKNIFISRKGRKCHTLFLFFWNDYRNVCFTCQTVHMNQFHIVPHSSQQVFCCWTEAGTCDWSAVCWKFIIIIKINLNKLT